MSASVRTRRILVIGCATAVLVSGWVHFYLYFRGGYRGIAPEEVLGITISRAFAINAIAAVLIAEALVLSLRWSRLLAPAVLGAAGFGASTFVAYILSRTTGLLGFTEDETTTEAVVALVAEIVAVVSALGLLATAQSLRGGVRQAVAASSIRP